MEFSVTVARHIGKIYFVEKFWAYYRSSQRAGKMPARQPARRRRYERIIAGVQASPGMLALAAHMARR
jgi:hypothetical protein